MPAMFAVPQFPQTRFTLWVLKSFFSIHGRWWVSVILAHAALHWTLTLRCFYNQLGNVRRD